MPEVAAAADSSTDGQTKCAAYDNGKILTMSTLNPYLKDLKTLVSYGLMTKRANEIDRLLALVCTKFV